MKSLTLLLVIFLFVSACSPDSNTYSQEKEQPYPGLESKDGLYYHEGEEKPFTGSTESKYENDVPFVQADFKDGKLHGTYTAYYMNGQKMGITNYKEGVKHGVSESWHENGNKASEISFVDGLEHGELKVYFPNGQLRMQAEFEKGERVGMQQEWDTAGTLINVYMHGIEEVEEL